MKRPGDFSEATIEVLAKRVAYLCSRASCRRRTIGPHSNEIKATLVGEAAHICAASPGGPRYDPSMSDEERRSHDNGIWLCANCATEIDKDPARFPVSLLRKWKEDAESEALKLLENPSYRNHQEHKDQLAAFLVEAQQLRNRLNEDPLPIRDHNAWVDRVSQYLKEHFGNAHEVRFSDFSGMTFSGDGSERSRMSRSLDGRSRRLHEFISELGV
jgi:hypothetical protein